MFAKSTFLTEATALVASVAATPLVTLLPDPLLLPHAQLP